MQKHTHTRAAERLRESTTRAAQLCACGSLAQSPSQPTREPSSRARRHTRGCVGRPLSHGRNTGATKSMHTGETNFSLDSGPTALHSPAQRHRQHDVCENGLSRSALPTNPDTHTHTTAPPVLSAPRASREPPRGHTRACAHTPRACVRYVYPVMTCAPPPATRPPLSTPWLLRGRRAKHSSGRCAPALLPPSHAPSVGTLKSILLWQ